MTMWAPAPGIEITDADEPALPPGDAREALAVRSWQAAEGRLYPLITVDAALYEEALTLVHEAVELLRLRCADVTTLIDVDPSDILAACPSGPVWAQHGLDPATAFDAARAFRWRELSLDRRVGSHDSTPGDPR